MIPVDRGASVRPCSPLVGAAPGPRDSDRALIEAHEDRRDGPAVLAASGRQVATDPTPVSPLQLHRVQAISGEHEEDGQPAEPGDRRHE
jgi:hypothetical protein